MSDRRHIAVYVRGNSGREEARSQERDLEEWGQAYSDDTPVRWYRDEAMPGPAWQKLEAELAEGRVACLVVWRIDRLGRTATELVSLLEHLCACQVGLISICEGLDLQTPVGRLFTNVMAGVAAYESEVRAEKQAAGIAAARAEGKKWGGRRPGARWRVSDELAAAIHREAAAGVPKAAIARLLGVSRPTVYRVLAEPSG